MVPWNSLLVTQKASLPYFLFTHMIRRYLELSVQTFINATEDAEKVMEALTNLFGEELPRDVEAEELEGVYRNPITLVRIRYRKERDISRILSRWYGTPFWNEAMERVEERLDDGLDMHVKVDKGSAYRGEIELWRKGGSIAITLKVATYPSSRERTLEILREGPLS